MAVAALQIRSRARTLINDVSDATVGGASGITLRVEFKLPGRGSSVIETRVRDVNAE